MGQFHFDVPETASDFIQNSLWQDAYICGIEGVPWQSRNVLNDSRLTISRSIDSSGKLYLACPLDGLGYVTLHTCSLRSIDQPYSLTLELARGSCYRARIQSDIWERAGLVLTDLFKQLLADGTSCFLDAALGKGDDGQAAVDAIKAIGLLEQASAELGEVFASQSLAFRKQREPQIGTLLAGTILPPSPRETSAAAYLETFNSAAVRLNWLEIETNAGRFDYDNAAATINWCATNKIRVIGGPLIDFRNRMLPEWLYLLEDDFEAFLSAVTKFVENTVLRFRGSVQLWNCASGLNTPGPLRLDDEQLMRLAIGILQTVRRIDPNTPTIMTFDQPFGEYLAKYRDGISPIHFADAIARSGLGLAGIGLDVRFNYAENASLPRSAVEFGAMIDRWATLGMPLLVQLGVPGGVGEDPLAVSSDTIRSVTGPAEDLADRQLNVAGSLIRTLVAKHIVHGIVWDGWSDAEPHVNCHSGLLDRSGDDRPLRNYLVELRREFLG